MSGMELLLLPEIFGAAAAETAATAGAAGLAGAGAAGAGSAGLATAAVAPGALVSELIATHMPWLAEGAPAMGSYAASPTLASMAAAPAASATTAGAGGLSGMLSQAPGLTTMMQNTGLLGSVVDATGGLATSTTAANNIGGGLLGNASRGVTSFMSSPDKLLKAGQLLGGPDKPQQQMPQAQPFSFQSQPTNLSQQAPEMSEQEKRRRMLMQIFQGG